MTKQSQRITIRVSPEIKSEVDSLVSKNIFPSRSCAVTRLTTAAIELLKQKNPEIMSVLLGVEND